MPATAPERPLTLSPNASATPRVCGMRNRPSRLAGQSPEGKVLGDECQVRIAKLTGTQSNFMCRSSSWHSASGRSGKVLVSAVLLSAPSRGIEFSACRTCTGSLPAAASSSAEYVVNVFLTSSRRRSCRTRRARNHNHDESGPSVRSRRRKRIGATGRPGTKSTPPADLVPRCGTTTRSSSPKPCPRQSLSRQNGSIDACRPTTLENSPTIVSSQGADPSTRGGRVWSTDTSGLSALPVASGCSG